MDLAHLTVEYLLKQDYLRHLARFRLVQDQGRYPKHYPRSYQWN